MAKRQVVPATFFLNEAHELTPFERFGGGRLPQYEGISWPAKAARISRSLRSVAARIQRSRDPLREDRFFVLTLPAPHVEKRSKDKKKAPRGTFTEATEFGGQHGKIFDRLGLDLLQVTGDGNAVVHAERETLDQLMHRTETLDQLGQREQARWATIDSFDMVRFLRSAPREATGTKHIIFGQVLAFGRSQRPVFQRTTPALRRPHQFWRARRH